MENPKPDRDSELRPDAAPGTSAERGARSPKPDSPVVTPLDDGKHIEQGIEVKET